MISCFFFSSRRRHTRFKCDWSSDVCSSDLDDGERRLLRSHDEERGVAEGHDHHRRLRPGAGLPDAAFRRERADLQRSDGDGARKGRHRCGVRGAGEDGGKPAQAKEALAPLTHSTLIPASLISLAYFAISDLIKATNCSGVL